VNDWRQVKLGDVADEVTVGHVGSMAQEYRSTGIPLLRSQNVLPHSFDLKDVKYIDSDFHARLKKSALRAGDVVTVRTGKPGATAVIPAHWAEANCSDLVITRPGSEINAHWLSYYINSAATGYIDSQLVGAVQQHFNVGAAKNMTLNLPPDEQERARKPGRSGPGLKVRWP
jgi:type I restriction enzyme S subunit